jgi:plastocyanin
VRACAVTHAHSASPQTAWNLIASTGVLLKTLTEASMSKLRVLLLVIGAGLLFMALPGPAAAGGGGGGGGSLCAGFSSSGEVVMRDNCFEGVAHFAAPGSTLRVHNLGQQPHNYTAIDGSFATPLLGAGQWAEIQVGAAGIVRVYCTLHGTTDGHGMSGVLVAGDAAGQGQAGAGARPLAAGAFGLAGLLAGGLAVGVAEKLRKA